MDKTLIWLLVPGLFVIIAFVRVSARHRRLSFDLQHYFLAGKNLSAGRFALATSGQSLLGLMALPFLGLLHRQGFSYGFGALGAVFTALASALFARRLWNLAAIFKPLTPAQLLGDYYRSDGMQTVLSLIALLIALCLTLMTLRLSGDLLYLVLHMGAPLAQTSLYSNPILLGSYFIIAILLFYLAAHGGMGAILDLAAACFLAVFLCFALLLFAAPETFRPVLFLLQQFSGEKLSPARLQSGHIFVSPLFAFAGLALSPAALMSNFTARKGQSLAIAQFWAMGLLTGLLLLASALYIAKSTPSALVPAPIESGPVELPVILVALALIAALVVSTSAALLAAGALSSSLFTAPPIDKNRNKKNGQQPLQRKTHSRWTIAIMLLIALPLCLFWPPDPLPLFLLAGALGLQLLPALLGLCYFESLGENCVKNGIWAGTFAVLVTSAPLHDAVALVGLKLPFAPWPLTTHPALWGLLANFALVWPGHLMAQRRQQSDPQYKTDLAHQHSWHVLPDGTPLMAPDAGKWRFAALLLLTLFLSAILLPLTPLPLKELLSLNLWGWQTLAWLIGLALVYVVAYRLQPTFDPELALQGSKDPRKRRFRIKANMRTAEPQTTSGLPAEQQEDTK